MTELFGSALFSKKNDFDRPFQRFLKLGHFFQFVHILAFMLKVLGPSRVKMVICWTFGFSRENEQNHETLETSRKKEKVKKM